VDVSTQLKTTLEKWEQTLTAKWKRKKKPLPPWIFPSRAGTAME
jgi:hypothetical protein